MGSELRRYRDFENSRLVGVRTTWHGSRTANWQSRSPAAQACQARGTRRGTQRVLCGTQLGTHSNRGVSQLKGTTLALAHDARRLPEGPRLEAVRQHLQ